MTELVYLNDTYLYRSTGNVGSYDSDEHGTYVILNKTIFYPQGGGQPADQGTISSETTAFKVEHVVLTPEGVVKHYGDFEKGNAFEHEEGVNLVVEKDRRILNAKLHSAGHLLDCAVADLGLPLKPTKGFHFPVGTYVEYEGVLENGNQYKEELERIINNLSEKDLVINAHYYSSEEAAQKGIVAPEGKSARFVEFVGYEGCGCGGTHVTSSGELGKIIIRKLKSKKGNTKISYALADYQV